MASPEQVEELVTRAQAGDEQAARELFCALYGDIRRIVYATLGRDGEAEDVCQTAAMELFRSLSRFRHDSRFSTWFYRLVVNTCLQHLRTRRSRAIPYDPQQAPDVPVAEANPEERAVGAEQSRLLREILDGMAPKKRLVFLWHDVEDVPLDEIAARLHSNKLTVKSRLFYARREFAKKVRQIELIEEARGLHAQATDSLPSSPEKERV